MTLNNVSLGTDPEIFVIGDGKVIPAFYALGGRSASLPHGEVTGDGAAVEWTQTPTLSPVDASTFLVRNLAATKQLVERRVSTIDGTRPAVLAFSGQPFIHVDPRYIASLPPEFGKEWSLQMFGCSPDENAYSFKPRRPNPKTSTGRSAGGHIHFGGAWTRQCSMWKVVQVVTNLDAILGLVPVIKAKDRVGAAQRMQLYGAHGTFRFDPEKTLEYRVLSAADLVNNAMSVFPLAQAVVEATIRDQLSLPTVALQAQLSKLLEYRLSTASELFAEVMDGLNRQSSEIYNLASAYYNQFSAELEV